MPETIGYARVSTTEQSLEVQRDMLAKAGCHKVYFDVASGAKQNRDGLRQCLEYLRKGDTLIVWKLDRLGRTVRDLVNIMNDLNNRGIVFVSITETMIDTKRPEGKIFFYFMSVFAEMERNNILERTKAGKELAMRKGVKFGRKFKMTPDKTISAWTAYISGEDLGQICKDLRITKRTFYKHTEALRGEKKRKDEEAKAKKIMEKLPDDMRDGDKLSGVWEARRDEAGIIIGQVPTEGSGVMKIVKTENIS